MVLFIKNMVCHRCKLMVEQTLKQVGLTPLHVELGEVTIAENKISAEQRQRFNTELRKIGFELLDDKRAQLVEQIKTLLIHEVHYNNEPTREKYSRLITQPLHHDYSYLSNLFSEVEGITIEQFIINQKIERVKERLIYGEQSLAQIALDLGYSSTAHLSNQFKKFMGVTPTQFKHTSLRNRRALDELGTQK